MAEIIRPDCYRCHGRNVKLRRQIIQNGSTQIGWWCIDCGLRATALCLWLSHADVTAFLSKHNATIENLPIIADYSNQYNCAVCGKPGTEYNHWAPQAMKEEFGEDWGNYPGDYLCVKHHNLWHAIMTPLMKKHLAQNKEIDNG